MSSSWIVYTPPAGIGLITEHLARRMNRDFGYDIQKHHTNVSINLSNQHMTLDAAKCIADYFKVSGIAYSVKVLDVSGITIVGGCSKDENEKLKDVLKALRQLAKGLVDAPLTCIDATNNYLGHGGIKNLDLLLKKPKLKIVCIARAGLRAKDIETIVGFLEPSARRLTHLCFDNNPDLGERGATTLASFMSKCPSLKAIELGGIMPGPKGTYALLHTIYILAESGTELVRINIKGATVVGAGANNLEPFKAALCHQTISQSLTYINAECSGIDRDAQRELADALFERSRAELAHENILLGDGTEEVEEDSQFVQLSMRG